MLLTDRGKLLLNFFCHKVENVIANNAIIVAINPAAWYFRTNIKT